MAGSRGRTAARKGQGDALITGFTACSGDIIVMVDADGSADGQEIVSYVSALVSGADFAKGSRFANGGGTDDMTPIRKLGNWALCSAVNAKFGARYTDLCYGYNAFWRHCLDDIDLDCTGFEVETLMNIRVVKAGLKVQEIPSHEYLRIHGASNLRAVRDGLRVLKVIMKERSNRRALRSRQTASKLTLVRGKGLDGATRHADDGVRRHLRVHRRPLERHPRRRRLRARTVVRRPGDAPRRRSQPGPPRPSHQGVRRRAGRRGAGERGAAGAFRRAQHRDRRRARRHRRVPRRRRRRRAGLAALVRRRIRRPARPRGRRAHRADLGLGAQAAVVPGGVRLGGGLLVQGPAARQGRGAQCARRQCLVPARRLRHRGRLRDRHRPGRRQAAAGLRGDGAVHPDHAGETGRGAPDRRPGRHPPPGAGRP